MSVDYANRNTYYYTYRQWSDVIASRRCFTTLEGPQAGGPMCTITGNFERLTVKTEPLTHRVYCALLQTPVLNGLLSRRKNTRFVPYIYALGLHTDDLS